VITTMKPLFALFFVFAVTQAAYDLNEAKQALMYSYSTYCPTNAIETWSCYWCNQTSRPSSLAYMFDNATNTFGFVSRQGSTIYVAFRGTKSASVQNWIVDLGVVFSSFQGSSSAMVHSGFLGAWNALKNQTWTHLKNALVVCPNCRIVFTGHSLGAGLATLAVADLKQQLPKNVIKVIHFGSPRVGNQGFFNFYTSSKIETWRVTWGGDLVVNLPPDNISWKGNKYHHLPTEVWYRAKLADQKNLQWQRRRPSLPQICSR